MKNELFPIVQVVKIKKLCKNRAVTSNSGIEPLLQG